MEPDGPVRQPYYCSVPNPHRLLQNSGPGPHVINRNHEVHIYLKYHSVCPLVGIGTGTHSPAGEGVGESQIWTTGEKA
jgi:hypothetical protein